MRSTYDAWFTDHDDMTTATASALIELFAAKSGFLLTGHEHPDGDCVGAQVALFHLLRQLGKDVEILNPDPLNRQFDFLLAHTPFGSYRRGDLLPHHDVAILLDCAELGRLNELGVALRECGSTLAVIDHHVGSEDGDGTVNFVDSTAPATGALVFDLYQELRQPLPTAAAEGVFLSLVSDTGWFRYSNTDARVLSLAATLIEAGVDASLMYDRLFRRNDRDSVELLATSLSRCGFSLDDRFAYACMDKALMDRAARLGFDTDPVLDPLRSVDTVEVVALFKERFDGSIKLSLRAKGDIDVHAIAATFGGGGHRKAAGAVIQAPMPAAVLAVEERVRQALSAE